MRQRTFETTGTAATSEPNSSGSNAGAPDASDPNASGPNPSAPATITLTGPVAATDDAATTRERSRIALVSLLAALDLGVAGDWLLRAPGAWALNFALWMTAVVVVLALLSRWRERPLWGETRALLAVALVFGVALAWRDAPALKLLDLAVAASAMALAAYGAGRGWARHAGVSDFAAAALAAGAYGAAGTPLLLTEVDWRGEAGGSRAARVGRAVLRGAVLALPLLAVFGALLVSADAVYARLVGSLRIDFGLVFGHVALVAVVAWASGGYLRAYVSGPRLPNVREMAITRPRVGVVEAAVALGLVDLLFLSFVLVQFRYLFGGAGMVDVTPGLSYADYARHGFFELVAVAALALPSLLAADWLFEPGRPRDLRLFRILAGVQLLLLSVIMASALQRMRLYQAAFGMTEDRLYATAFMGWLALVFLWFAATVLRGKRARFAFGAWAAGLGVVAALNVLSPDALIARTNLSRAAAGADFDAAYAASLSADAAPALVAAADRLPAASRCRLVTDLAKRHWTKQPSDWRLWSWGLADGRSAVRSLDVEAACAGVVLSPGPETRR